jgi:hypothetical protein
VEAAPVVAVVVVEEAASCRVSVRLRVVLSKRFEAVSSAVVRRKRIILLLFCPC